VISQSGHALVSCVFVVVPLLASCSAASDRTKEDPSLAVNARSASPAVTQPAASVPVSVRVGRDNYVSVRTFADATCMLSPDGDAGADKTLLLHADANEMVSFQFSPDAAGVATTLVLNCEDATSAVHSYTVELQASTATPVLTAPTPKGQLRPALTGDPTTPTNNELVAAGYPPRPDPDHAPREYQSWIDDVSRPMIRVSSKLAKHPRRVPVASGACTGGWCIANWAGYVVPDHAPYLAAQGNWTVFSISAERSGKSDEVVAWVGLGGFGAAGGGLWQAGTIQTAYWSNGGYVKDATPPTWSWRA